MSESQEQDIREAVAEGMNIAARALLALKHAGLIDGFSIVTARPYGLGEEDGGHDVIACCAYHMTESLHPELCAQSTDPQVRAMVEMAVIDGLSALAHVAPPEVPADSPYAEFRDRQVTAQGFPREDPISDAQAMRDMFRGFHGLDGGDDLSTDSYTRQYNERAGKGKDMEGGYN